MFLFRFNSFILAPVLTDWIDIRHLTKLDTATCNHENRTNLLDLMASDSFVHDTTESYSDRFYFDWLVARSVKIKNITLESFSYVRIRPAVLKVLWNMKTIRHITTHCSSERVVLLREIGYLVESISILPMDSSEDHEYLPYILAAFPNLTSLAIDGVFSFNDDDERATIKSTVPKLTSLDISAMENVPDEFLKQILTNCENLTEFRLACEQLSITDVELIIASCPKLTLLDAECCTFAQDGLIKLTSNLPLKHLSLPHTKEVTNEILTKVCAQCRFLETINLANISVVNDDVLFTLVKNCCSEGLKEIALDSNQDFSDMGLIALLTKSLRLEVLTLSHCSQLTDRTLFAIAKHCKNMRKLNISYCNRLSDFAVTHLMRECKNIKMEIIFRGVNASDSVFIEGAQGSEVLHVHFDCPHGKDSIKPIQGKNGLSGVRIISNDVKINPHAFVTVALLCPMLVELSLNNVNTISSDIICEIISNCPLLKHVTLWCGKGVISSDIVKKLTWSCDGLETIILTCLELVRSTADTLVAGLLIKHGETLKTFHLFNSVGVTDQIFDTIGRKCHQLTSLAMTYVGYLFDHNVVIVAKYCKELRVLDLSGCTLLTDNLLTTLSEYCIKLRKLVLEGCKGMYVLTQIHFLCHSPNITELICSDGAQIDNNF